jgi:Rha family phage regulatory protein
MAVAEHFEKRHSEVLRAIKNLECSTEFHEAHFWPGEYIDRDGKKKPMFRLTRDGFAMLVIGFTDRLGRSVKRAYLAAFQQLESSSGTHTRFGEGVGAEGMPSLPAAPTVFQFDDMNVRAFERDEQIWFVAADVCAALELDNVTKALLRLDEDEQTLTSIQVRSENGVEQNREVNIINESGLYSLVLGSRKASAKRFKKWVTAEVLPAIRKTGRYEAPSPAAASQPVEALSSEEVFLRLYYAFDQNAGPAVLLWVLMQMGAASDWIGPSLREIAEASGGRISKSNVTRCAVNLKQRGLIDLKADLPWSRSNYLVFGEAVVKLLQEVGKQLAGLPGIQDDDESPLLLGMGVKTLH